MADIELRFHKDMLVLSAPLAFALANQGVDMETEAEYMSLVEPETMRDALRLESMAGAQCLVAETDICEARLARSGTCAGGYFPCARECAAACAVRSWSVRASARCYVGDVDEAVRGAI